MQPSLQHRYSVLRLPLLVGCLLGAVAARAEAATIATQYPDYAPGETVMMTGSGWEPGETVTIELHEDPTLCPNRLLSAVADENGDILNTDFVPDQHDIGVTFTATASGLSSGLTAETTFTDNCPGGFEPDPECPATDLAHCIVGCSQKVQGVRVCHPDNKTAAAEAGTVCRTSTG